MDRNDGRVDRAFFPVMSLLITVTVFAGFAASFYLRDAAQPPLATLLVVHGVVFTAWVLLFVVQTTLIAANRVEVHKRLGWAGAALAVALIALGTLAAVRSLRLGRAPIPGLDPRSFFAVPFFDMVVFTLLIGAGIRFRTAPETHRRLMLLATIGLLDAAVARLPVAFIASGGPPVFFALADLFILAGWAFDLARRRRIHPAFLWGGLLLILSQPLRLVLGGTAAWKGFADLFMP